MKRENVRFVKRRYTRRQLSATLQIYPDPGAPSHHGICPFCKEEIKREAVKCKHCGSMLTAQATCGNCACYRVMDPMILRMIKDRDRERAIAACRTRCQDELVDFLNWCDEHFPHDRKGRLACKNAAYDDYRDCDGGCGGATALMGDLLAWR